MSDYLIHYGVKGMKWGVRHDRERAGVYRVSSRQVTRRNNKYKNLNRSFHKTNDSSDQNNKSSRLHLTDKQKRYLKIGAAVVATGLIAYGSYRLYKKVSPDFRQYSLKAQAKMRMEMESSKGKPFDPFKSLEVVNPTKISQSGKDLLFRKGAKLEDLDVADILKYRSDLINGRFSNCAKCTIAADMRSRGYDVVAGSSAIGQPPSRMFHYYKNSVTLDINGRQVGIMPGQSLASRESTASDTDSIIRQLKGLDQKKMHVVAKKWSPVEAKTRTISTILSMGEGASGDITLRSRGYKSGHSMYFKVINNRVRVFDYQTGLSFDAEKEFFSTKNNYFSDWDFNTVHMTRLDNIEPDINEMLRWNIIKPRGGTK